MAIFGPTPGSASSEGIESGTRPPKSSSKMRLVALRYFTCDKGQYPVLPRQVLTSSSMSSTAEQAATFLSWLR
eukprot:6173646-Pleurochrysis_carterae.AAC.2